MVSTELTIQAHKENVQSATNESTHEKISNKKSDFKQKNISRE